MTVRRIYSCNVCRDELDVQDIVGIQWAPGSAGMQFSAPALCEQHICHQCIGGIQRQAKDPATSS